MELSEVDFKILKIEDFSVIAFSGPFERLARKQGTLNVLKEIARDPRKVAMLISRETDQIMYSIRSLLKKESGFGAAWIWSDLAHKDNLYFSPEFYEKFLFPIHKRLISFLKSLKMSVIFHSDGKIDKLVPYLAEAGVEAFHPLDEYADMNIGELKKRYSKELVFL